MTKNEFIEERVKEFMGDREQFIQALGGDMGSRLLAVSTFDNTVKRLKTLLSEVYDKGYSDGAYEAHSLY